MTNDTERFARDCSQGAILALRRMGGATFTESDRRAMVDGLQIIRTAMAQPVGATSAASRVKGAVTGREYDRAVMQVICSAMQLWLSGKLGEVECDRDAPQKAAEEMFGKMRHSTKEEADAYDAMLKSKSVEIHPVDRDALLALAEEMQGYADGAASVDGFPYVNAGSLWSYADRIREACGVVDAG